jgi:hypothetical protein
MDQFKNWLNAKDIPDAMGGNMLASFFRYLGVIILLVTLFAILLKAHIS